MNTSADAPLEWSRGRWWIAFAVAVLLQVAIIYALSDRRPITPRRHASAPDHHLFLDLPPGAAISALVELGDPTLPARPSLRGFSGAAWLRPQPVTYRSADPVEPARWLDQDVSGLGATFVEFVRTNAVVARPPADRPRPVLTEVSPPPVPLPMRSSFRIEGAIAARKLVAGLETPSVPHTDVLTNTVVQLGVNADGFPLSAVVLRGSGSKTVDQQALALVRTIRFAPVRSANGWRTSTALMWGRIVFQWHTVEPPAGAGPGPTP